MEWLRAVCRPPGAWLLLSILLHLGPFVFSIWHPAPGRRTLDSSGGVIQVEVKVKGSSASQAYQVHASRALAKSGVPLSDLRLKPRLRQVETPSGNATSRLGTSSQASSERQDEAIGPEMSIERSLEVNSFMTQVSRRIFEGLRYPDDFVRSRLTGLVQAQVELDHRGVFAGRFVALSGSSDLMTAYVGATLVSSLDQPISSKSWLTAGRLYPVNLSFRFEIYNDQFSEPDDQSFVYKNAIHAHLVAYAEPIFNQRIEEWMTNYFPPIIPLPGGVYIDFVRAYQLIQNLGEPTESDLRERRLKMLHEGFRSALGRRG